MKIWYFKRIIFYTLNVFLTKTVDTDLFLKMYVILCFLLGKKSSSSIKYLIIRKIKWRDYDLRFFRIWYLRHKTSEDTFNEKYDREVREKGSLYAVRLPYIQLHPFRQTLTSANYGFVLHSFSVPVTSKSQK